MPNGGASRPVGGLLAGVANAPPPPENDDALLVLRALRGLLFARVRIFTGFYGFRRLIETHSCAGVHLDMPKSGGLLECKRISDFADSWNIWTAAHNPASAIGTIASVHAAASMRGFRIHELAKWVNWWPDLVTHEGSFWKDGYYTIEDKPGLVLT